MTLNAILQIRDLMKQEGMNKTMANYMINQMSYNLPSVIKTNLPEVEEALNAIDEIAELYHKLEK